MPCRFRRPTCGISHPTLVSTGVMAPWPLVGRSAEGIGNDVRPAGFAQDRPRTEKPGPLTMQPLVSIIMPVFNRLQFLGAAIESVFEQSFSDWELLIADDGSDPQTQEYLHRLDGIPRLRVL